MKYILILFIFAYVSSSETLEHKFQVLINETEKIMYDIYRISRIICVKPNSSIPSIARPPPHKLDIKKVMKGMFCSKIEGFLLDKKKIVIKAKSIVNNSKDIIESSKIILVSDIYHILNQLENAKNDVKKEYEYCQFFLSPLQKKLMSNKIMLNILKFIDKVKL